MIHQGFEECLFEYPSIIHLLKCRGPEKYEKHRQDTPSASVVQSQFYEATRILFVCKKNKNNDFFQQNIQNGATLTRRDREEILEKCVYFIFKYCRRFIKLRLNH